MDHFSGGTRGQTIDPAYLIAFLKERMTQFMVHLDIRSLSELPKSPSAKFLKHELRAKGMTAIIWDREAAGIRIKDERLDAGFSGGRLCPSRLSKEKIADIIASGSAIAGDAHWSIGDEDATHGMKFS